MTGLCECGCGEATTISAKTDRGAGRVKGQPVRYVLGHSLRLVPKLKPVPPAWHVEDRGFDTECWIWDGSIMNAGYGEVRKPVRQLAHRWSYEHFVGPIPDGLHIDHLCRVRECVNPDHLEAVTLAENNRRSVKVREANRRAAA